MGYNFPYDINMNMNNMNMGSYAPKAPYSINWINGIEGAKACTLKPKESIILMDSEADNVFYIKFCDEIGKCTLKRCVYHEEPENVPKQVDLSDYVKLSDLDKRIELKINQMLGGNTNEQTISAT